MTNNISLEHYLILSSLLFIIGTIGLFIKHKTVINVLMSIEIMLLAVNINFIAFSVYLQDIVGQVFSLIILSIAAAEISIGLAILVLYFRNRSSIAIGDINRLKG
ncbi:MAG: NADH-quinone oxidoreductase subunit NuoK [Rickettsiaceae bacterium]|nr:NADH-quinone oxidoreductase subunit NuoK [Rickettsiaceae bacterium]